MNQFKEELLPEFKKYILEHHNRKLSNVQYIVEFYFWIQELDKQFEPFNRHVAAAKKINDYYHADLTKALRHVWEAKLTFEEKNLNWTLDTAFKWTKQISEYVESAEETEEIMDKQDKIERERVKQMKAEGRGLKNYKPDEDDEDF